MSRLSKPLLAVALFAFASFARADSLRLLAPASGVTLRGGTFAELRWSSSDLTASAEEWEAFLSIDGGKYYAFRVTPHLEIERRRFTFIVPNVETHEARILIRTGDEVHEAHFEAQGTFSIARDTRAELIVPGLLHFGPGEAARDGDPAVVAWTAGARNGSGVTQQTAPTIPPRSLRSLMATSSDAPAAVLAPVAKSVHARSSLSTQQTFTLQHTSRAEPLPVSVDLLLVCSRRNV